MIDHSASPIKGITDSFRNADGKLFYRVHWCDTWESAISLQKYQIYIDEYWRTYEEESKNINELSDKESGSFGQHSVFSNTESGFPPKCSFFRQENEKETCETCDVAVQYEKYIQNIGIQCTALLHDAGVQTLTSHCSRGIQIDLINNVNQPFQKPPTQVEDSKRFTRIKKKCNNVYRSQSTNVDEKKTQPHTNEQKRNVIDQNSNEKINVVHQFLYKTVKTIDHRNCENVKGVDENKYTKTKIVDQNNLEKIKTSHENHNKMKSYDQNSCKSLETIHQNSHEQIKAIDKNLQISKTIHLNNCEKIETTNKKSIEQKETVDKNYRNIQMMDKSSHERLEAINQSSNEQIYKPMYFIVNDMKEDVGHMNGKKLNEITNKIPSELKRSRTDVLSEPPIILEKNLKLDCDTENNNTKENYSNLSKDKDGSSQQETSQNHINNEDDINNQFLSRYW